MSTNGRSGLSQVIFILNRRILARKLCPTNRMKKSQNYFILHTCLFTGSLSVDPITPDSQRSMDVDSECSEKQ